LYLILIIQRLRSTSFFVPFQKEKKNGEKGEGGDVLKKKGNEKLENRKVVRRICTVYAAPLCSHCCNNELKDFWKSRGRTHYRKFEVVTVAKIKISYLLDHSTR
jgi:hypothetical protein